MGRLKKDEMVIEMEVDAGVPQAESAEMKSLKRNVIRGESENLKVMSVRSVWKKRRSWRWCGVLSASLDEPFTSATIGAVRKRSDTCSLLRWSLKKVAKLEE